MVATSWRYMVGTSWECLVAGMCCPLYKNIVIYDVSELPVASREL
jgi:hypothetical protein